MPKKVKGGAGRGKGRRPPGQRKRAAGPRRAGALAEKGGKKERASELARCVCGGAFPVTRRKRGQGLGAVIAVVEGGEGGWDRACVVVDGLDRAAGGQPAMLQASSRAVRRLATRARVARLADLLAALASSHRLKLLLKLLEGPATYASLRKAAQLKAGPLYHHIAQLRLAGLIGPKERDLYELTRAGRNVLLAALALPGLASDRRRRL